MKKWNQVTFGDSDGRLDTQAGSLTLGWTGVPPMGNTGVNGTGVLETNAVVCAAGAGALPSTGTAQATGARTGLLDAGVDMSSSAVQRIALQNDGAQAGAYLFLGLVLCCLTEEGLPTSL